MLDMKVIPLLMKNVLGITAACRKTNRKEPLQREGRQSGITIRAAASTDSGTFRIQKHRMILLFLG